MNTPIFRHWNNALFETKIHFQKPWDTPMDGQLTMMYLKIDQFYYPFTIPNVENNNDCWFHLKVNASLNKIDS